MTLKELILNKKKEALRKQDELESLNSYLEILYSSKEVSFDELIKDESKYLTITHINGKYEKILGGDGRSAPWSEMVNGNLIRVNLKEPFFYISEETIKMYKEFLKIKYPKTNEIYFI